MRPLATAFVAFGLRNCAALHNTRRNGPASLYNDNVFSGNDVQVTSQQLTPEIQSVTPNHDHDKSYEKWKAAERRSKRIAMVNKLLFMSANAFLMGVADVVCFKRYGFFATMMTGNVIRSSTALVEGNWRRAAKHGSMVVGYSLGAALFRVIDILVKRRRRGEDKELISGKHGSSASVAAPVGAGLLILAEYLNCVSSTNGLYLNLHLPILSLSFGLMNSASMDVFGSITNAMTGHVGNIGKGIADRIIWKLEGSQRKKKSSGKTRISTSILAGFMAGITSGTLISNILTGQFEEFPVFALLGVLSATLLFFLSNPINK